MESQTTPCPSPFDLEVHVTSQHSDQGIADHLENCIRCRSAAEEILANNAMMERLRSADLQAGREPTSDRRIGPPHSDSSIEGYELLEEMSRGGQGIVYRARQRTTNRIVALKVLLAGAFATSSQRRRFEREIELVASLEHPNIVTVYDSGIMPDGCLYFAMRYVQGIPLDRWLRSGQENKPLSLPELLDLFGEICDGVTHAHLNGVIHRDLKP
ncbi:MAG: serine/threonine protein kinase, partial [Phycisphaerales bacterium]